MNSQCYILCAAMLTAMLITSQSEFTLVFPVWAIVAVSSALPVVVILAAMMCIETLKAAVLGRHARRFCLAMEGIATMLADKLLGLAFLGDAITSTAAVVPMVARANIKSESFATLFADKFDEWIFSVRARLVPARVVLSMIMSMKASERTILVGGQARAAYLAVKGFATTLASKLAGESICCFGGSITNLTAVFPRRFRGIGSEAETLATMFADSYRWGFSGADDSTSGYAPRFDWGHTSRRWCLSMVS